MYRYIEEEGCGPPFNFSFITDNDLKYITTFNLSDIVNTYPFSKLYEFSFSKFEEEKPKEDKKISITIINIIVEFLENNQESVIFYACDPSDNRHKCRIRLFNRWSLSSSIENLTMYNINLGDSDIEMACIYNSDFYKDNIIEENIILYVDALDRDKN